MPLNPPLAQRLGVDLANAYTALMDAKNAALAAHDLTVPRYAVLATLLDSDGASGADLARACAVTPQSMSEILTALTTQGLVRRERHSSGRILSTHLTAAGRDRVEAADIDAGAVESALTQEFSPQERELLRTLLARAGERLRSTSHPGRAGGV